MIRGRIIARQSGIGWVLGACEEDKNSLILSEKAMNLGPNERRRTGLTVVEVGYKSADGNYVKVDIGGGYTVGYCHFGSRPNLSIGQDIFQGQFIGNMGSSGISTGSHLHFGIRDSNGNAVNPMNYLPYNSNMPKSNDVGYEPTKGYYNIF